MHLSGFASAFKIVLSHQSGHLNIEYREVSVLAFTYDKMIIIYELIVQTAESLTSLCCSGSTMTPLLPATTAIDSWLLFPSSSSLLAAATTAGGTSLPKLLLPLLPLLLLLLLLLFPFPLIWELRLISDVAAVAVKFVKP